MKRSGWVTALIAIQAALTVTMLGSAIYLLVLSRSSEVLSQRDGAEVARGLRIAASFCFPVAVAYAGSVFGLWKRRLWGWWLGLVLTTGAVVTLTYSVIDDGWKSSDATDLALPIFFAVLLILLFIPAVRNHYRPRGNSALNEVSIPRAAV